MRAIGIILLALVMLGIGVGGGFYAAMQAFSIDKTVYKVQVKDGLSPEDVRQSIMSKAVELNMKFVGHQPLSKELQARGVKSGQIDIFQFCNPEDARKIIDHDMTFAAYMPCRIVLVEDGAGHLWLEMLDLDLMIKMANLSGETLEIGKRVNTTLKAIMDAGRSGDF